VLVVGTLWALLCRENAGEVRGVEGLVDWERMSGWATMILGGDSRHDRRGHFLRLFHLSLFQSIQYAKFLEFPDE